MQLTNPQSGRKGRLLATAAMTAAAAITMAGCATTSTSEEEVTEPAAWAPDRDITWIVPYSPGGGFDTYSRGIAQTMVDGGFLPDGVNVVIDNVVPLPQGIAGMFNAEPDGYTIGILPMPAAAAQELQNDSLAPWTTDDFTVLGSVDENAYVVYVADNSPFQTIDDLIAGSDMKAITVEEGSSSALAGVTTIAGLELDATTTYGAEGSAEVVAAALRGDADFFVYGSTDLTGFVDSGDIRPLLYLGTDEGKPDFPWLADTPTITEIGYPELAGSVTELRAIVGPPGMPDEVFAYLSDAIYSTMTSDLFETWAADAERQIVPKNAADASVAMRAQIAAMEILIPQLEG